MMKRPVKKQIDSSENLPFVLLLHPRGNNKRLWPYPVDLVTEIQGVDLDLYVNAGKSQVTGYEMGYTMVLDKENKPQRNKIPLISYKYSYMYTITDERMTL